MQSPSAAPHTMVAGLWQQRRLIMALMRREVVGRYKGSSMGLLWSLFNPMLMLTVYTFVFSVVFKTRWNAASDSRTEFALILFAGLIVFNLFSDCINRAPGLIVSNVNYVKKVVFPIEILPVVTLGAALFHALVSLAVWLVFYLAFFGLPQPTALLLPFALLPLLLLTLGSCWFLASLGVYLRDVSQVIGVLSLVLMFLSPIFFPVSALPVQYQVFLSLNPLTPVIEQVRDMLIWGRLPAASGYLLHLGISALVACLGFAWFQKTREGFADVL